MELGNQNILFFTRTMGLGGTENVILQLCEILNLKVNNIIVCSCGGINVRELELMGITHYTIPDIEKKNICNIFKIIRTVRNILRKESITIVHSHHRMAAFYSNVLCSKNIIKVANVHNTFTNKKKLTKLAYTSTKIIAVGEQVKKNLIEFYEISEGQVTVICNSVKKFTGLKLPIKKIEEQRSNILIGNIGRLSEQKGMEYFIKAAAELYKKISGVRFYIIGAGENQDDLCKLAKEILPEGVLFFLGYRSDIQNVMSQLDFVVLSSLWEGFPLTPIESFSVGKTVVATAVDGTPESWRPRESPRQRRWRGGRRPRAGGRPARGGHRARCRYGRQGSAPLPDRG